MITQKARRRGRSICLTVLTWAILFITIYPLYDMAVTSTQKMADIIKVGFDPIPSYISLQNYLDVLEKGNFLQFMGNSIRVALVVSLVGTMISTLGGYSLARLPFPGKGIIDKSVLFVYIVPPILLVIPIYVTLVRLHLQDTYTGLILTHTLFAIPFGTWLMRGFIKSIPVELDDAALVDGANRLTILTRVVGPICSPGMAAVAIFSFVASWDEFLFGSIIMLSNAKRTIPPAIYSMVGFMGEVQWGEIMAATTLAAIPMFLFFLFFQKYMISGMTAGAVK